VRAGREVRDVRGREPEVTSIVESHRRQESCGLGPQLTTMTTSGIAAVYLPLPSLWSTWHANFGLVLQAASCSRLWSGVAAGVRRLRSLRGACPTVPLTLSS
jgi:hypothetical protein